MADMTLLLMAVLLICFGLICYSDFRWFVIPNAVNAAILLAGLMYRAEQGASSVTTALAFGLVVAALMWTIRYVHFKFTGRLGLGLGDVKLAGAAAVWFSPLMFPVFLFLASALALLFLAGSSLTKRQSLTTKIPFGPFLAASLIITWNIERLFDPFIGPIL
ncbi:prepilin peptidase [Neorhizobium petrolearium]|uniref:prepilin peptidase n=1 Tax=Neorhizobium petrolearium TaxID=515361 RepID=UPI003F7E0FFD